MTNTASADTTNNPKHCPLCGEANLCTIAIDKNAVDCWCRHTTIKPELIAQTQQLKQEKSCICQRCAVNSPIGIGASDVT